MKIFIFVLNLITFTFAIKIKSLTTQQNTDLFKYDPNDEYTLPEDIDDDIDKPPVLFSGDVMKAQTLALENKNHGQGKFKYRLQTQNGIELTQVGRLKDPNTFVVSGSYSYTGADGRRYRVRYTADEFGYHPITELDIEIPEIQPIDDVNNDFRFSRQNLRNNGYGGNAQIGDDYSYANDEGYHYDKPEKEYLPPVQPAEKPSRHYLPVYF